MFDDLFNINDPFNHIKGLAGTVPRLCIQYSYYKYNLQPLDLKSSRLIGEGKRLPEEMVRKKSGPSQGRRRRTIKLLRDSIQQPVQLQEFYIIYTEPNKI